MRDNTNDEPEDPRREIADKYVRMARNGNKTPKAIHTGYKNQRRAKNRIAKKARKINRRKGK
jgi:hypothetical protein